MKKYKCEKHGEVEGVELEFDVDNWKKGQVVCSKCILRLHPECSKCGSSRLDVNKGLSRLRITCKNCGNPHYYTRVNCDGL